MTIGEQFVDDVLYITRTHKGKLHGECLQKRGQITTKRTFYKNGKKHGLCTKWTPTGIPVKTVNYKRNLKHGLYRRWHLNGEAKVEANYYRGNLHTVRQAVTPPVGPTSEIADKVVNGLYVERTENGQITKIATYDNGTLNGKYARFYPSGALKFVLNFSGGKRHGESMGLSPRGKVLLRMTYNNGELVE